MNLRRLTAAAGTLVLLGGAAVALAADDNKIIYPGTAPHAAAPTGGSGGIINSLSLILALALAAAGAWMVWRNRRGPAAIGAGRKLAIEETRSLGNRQYLVVAAYGEKRFLLGVCPGRIDLLSPLDAQREDPS